MDWRRIRRYLTARVGDLGALRRAEHVIERGDALERDLLEAVADLEAVFGRVQETRARRDAALAEGKAVGARATAAVAAGDVEAGRALAAEALVPLRRARGLQEELRPLNVQLELAKATLLALRGEVSDLLVASGRAPLPDLTLPDASPAQEADGPGGEPEAPRIRVKI
jgi:phage shock protein A